MQFRRQFIKSFLTSITWWLGVAISLTLYQLAVQMVEQKGQAQFDHQIDSARLAIDARIQTYVDVLRATRAMFHASVEVTRQEFRTYVTELNLRRSFPGINNINFAPRVLDRDKAAFESSVRIDRSADANGYPDFAIKPAGTRAEYHVLTYLEPMEGNRDALGLDLAYISRGKEVLIQLQDTGELVSSGKLIQIDGSQNGVGMALRMPLYRQGMPLDTVPERRAAYYGSVGAGIDIGKLMQGAIPGQALHGLRMKLYDIGPSNGRLLPGTTDPQHLLFDSLEASQKNASPMREATLDRNIFSSRMSLSVGSRMWEIEFSEHKDVIISGLDIYLPWLVLAGGLLASLFAYTNQYSLTTARGRAIEIADDMTRDLRTSQADLAEAQHMAQLGSWLLDPVSGSMAWSEETCRIFGAFPTDKNPEYGDFLARVPDAERQRIRDGLEMSIRSGNEFHAEHRIAQYGGSIRWVQTITRPGYVDRQRMLRGTIMDITDRKNNMEALKRSHELLRELTAHQDRIKEAERKRIAREIHDELGQTMLALRIDVSMLDTRTAESHPKINERVRSVLQHIDATVKAIRTIINNLRPAVLDLGLTAAVEWQVGEFRRRTGIQCELVMDANEYTMSDARATTLFRILQESLSNVTRHANATKVRIALFEDTYKLVMQISDDGVGIDQEDRNKSDSFGLVGIEERILALEGAFTIDSAPDSGTTLTIFIPLENSDDAAPEITAHKQL